MVPPATVTTAAATTWGMTSGAATWGMASTTGWPALTTAESSTAWRATEASASTAGKATEPAVWLALRECMRSTTAGITTKAAALRGKMRRVRAIVATRDPAIIAARNPAVIAIAPKHIGAGK